MWSRSTRGKRRPRWRLLHDEVEKLLGDVVDAIVLGEGGHGEDGDAAERELTRWLDDELPTTFTFTEFWRNASPTSEDLAGTVFRNDCF